MISQKKYRRTSRLKGGCGDESPPHHNSNYLTDRSRR
jgi:hypothetical protein